MLGRASHPPVRSDHAVAVDPRGKGFFSNLLVRTTGNPSAKLVSLFVDPDTDARPPDGCSLIDAADTTAVRAALDSAWCVASATGIAGALGPWAEYLAGSDLVLANLGAEDEFGPDMPEARVLNDKAPVNFALAEPTHLRYIDATMALHNAGAVELLTGSYRPGIQRPPRAVEDDILDVVHHCGTIELSTIEEDLL